jgi:hypothetical protein
VPANSRYKKLKSSLPAVPPRPERPSAKAEIELKLRASPAAIEQIRKAPVILQNARNRGVVRRLDTVYYDTPETVRKYPPNFRDLGLNKIAGF